MSRYNQKYQPFYQSSEWKELRERVLQDNNYLCSECKKKGIIRTANTVHHKIPIEVDWSKRLDYDNCIAVCGSENKKTDKGKDKRSNCHNKLHERRSQLSRFLEEWED